MKSSKTKDFETPILINLFNRPHLTQRVFDSVRTAKPRRLYLAFDGARPDVEDDLEKIEQVKDIACCIDWDCSVTRLYRQENLGPGRAISSAINWFFDSETEGIILEDDTIPSYSFFLFCEELLKEYREDSRIGMIAGTNHIGPPTQGTSFLFSRNQACWGWATWKRSWSSMDFAMHWRQSPQKPDVFEAQARSRLSRRHWARVLSKIDRGAVDAWDWQWYFSLASQSQLTIFPSRNLVANLGFGAGASHTTGASPERYRRIYEISFPLEKPDFVVPDHQWDQLFEKEKMSIRSIINRKLLSLFHSLSGTEFSSNTVRVGDEEFTFDPIPLVRGLRKMDLTTARENLEIASEILTGGEVRWGLAFGTLLGLFRNGDLIEHDEDVDLYVFSEDRGNLLALLQIFEKRDFKIARSSKKLLSLVRNGEHIDIYFLKKSLGRRRMMGFSFPNKAFVYSKSIDALQKMYPVPSRTEEVIRRIYGPDWRVPALGKHAQPRWKRLLKLAFRV